MNPKISINVDANNKAIATMTGIVSVGSKVDVEISGLPTTIPDWGADDKFTGKSLRFRIVDECGRDLVRYPLVEKTTEPVSAGDTWTVDATTNVYTNTSGCVVEFDTDVLRKEFCGVSYNETNEFGVILDSIVDAAEYAVGKTKIRQWAKASTEDPTVLPDWRETLAKLKTDIETVETSKSEAVAASSLSGQYANASLSYAQSAANSAGSASTSANASSSSASTAASKANESLGYANQANEAKILAQAAKSGAESAKLSAEVAASHYPYIGANSNWYVWDVNAGAFVDTGRTAVGGHNLLHGKTFARPTSARGWYDLLAYLITEMGGNIAFDGIIPGSAPVKITMTCTEDSSSRDVKIVKTSGEYTMEVV